ncbi:MAG: hypothetical protein NTX40_11850 [Planctomycetota bacterium]|nr:hypothetical protein [Planctomycetota bacterium]
MRRQLGFCVLLVAGAAVVLGAAGAGVKVAPDPENVVASRLAGTWGTDKDLWTRLAGGPVSIPGWSFRFEADESVAAGLPARYADFLKDKPIYLAGRISGGHLSAACPFVLTVLHGNPHVVYFREKDGDPMGDAESFNVMLARGDKPENDILFIGGDFNNQPFTAYRHVAEPRPAQ